MYSPLYPPGPPSSYYQQNQQRQQQIGLRGYPVSSLEEARAALVDFDGSIFIFPDIVNKKIYTKQINMDGTATLNMYELSNIPTATPIAENNNIYVTKTDFETAIKELKELFNTDTAKNNSKINF